MVNKVNGLLGICAKAGKVLSGTDVVLEGISKKKVNLVIVATDSSEKTIKNIKYFCDKENIEMIIYGNIFENSRAIGKRNRAIIAICDINLADAIKKEIHGGVEFGEN